MAVPSRRADPRALRRFGGPEVAVAADGSASALWLAREAGAWMLRGARRGPGGAWIATPPLAPDANTAWAAPAAHLNARGDAVAAWIIPRPGSEAAFVPPGTLRVATRAASGAWSRVATLGESEGGADAAIGVRRGLAVAWTALSESGREVVVARAGGPRERLVVPGGRRAGIGAADRPERQRGHGGRLGRLGGARRRAAGGGEPRRRLDRAPDPGVGLGACSRSRSPGRASRSARRAGPSWGWKPRAAPTARWSCGRRRPTGCSAASSGGPRPTTPRSRSRRTMSATPWCSTRMREAAVSAPSTRMGPSRRRATTATAGRS